MEKYLEKRVVANYYWQLDQLLGLAGEYAGLRRFDRNAFKTDIANAERRFEEAYEAAIETSAQLSRFSMTNAPTARALLQFLCHSEARSYFRRTTERFRKEGGFASLRSIYIDTKNQIPTTVLTASYPQFQMALG